MDVVLVVLSTAVFGIFSKVLAGVPYMTWGYFDQVFWASFILWLLYMASLYAAVKMQNGQGEGCFKIILKALSFGTGAALVKMGIDAVTKKIVMGFDNAMYTAAVMELCILLFGSAAMVFLYSFVAKKKITSWKTSLNVYAAVAGGVIAVYLVSLYYYLFKIKWALERFGDMEAVQKIGTEQAKWNLSVKFAGESAVVGMLVYAAFFITLWLALRKNMED